MTYRVLDKNSNRVQVMKKIRKTKKKMAFPELMQRLKELDSRFIVRYLNSSEKETGCLVAFLAPFDGIDCNGEL